jgi:flagellar protein FlbD
MIRVTRLNHVPVVLNSDLIEFIEVTPDTVISLTNGQKLMVRESSEEVVDRVVAFRRRIFSDAIPPAATDAAGHATFAHQEGEGPAADGK